MYVAMGQDGEIMPVRKGEIFSWEGGFNLGYYQSEFEDRYLNQTRTTYLSLANQWIN